MRFANIVPRRCLGQQRWPLWPQCVDRAEQLPQFLPYMLSVVCDRQRDRDRRVRIGAGCLLGNFADNCRSRAGLNAVSAKRRPNQLPSTRRPWSEAERQARVLTALGQPFPIDRRADPRRMQRPLSPCEAIPRRPEIDPRARRTVHGVAVTAIYARCPIGNVPPEHLNIDIRVIITNKPLDVDVVSRQVCAVSNRSIRSRRRRTCSCSKGSVIFCRVLNAPRSLGETLSPSRPSTVRVQSQGQTLHTAAIAFHPDRSRTPARSVHPGAVATADTLHDACPRSQFGKERVRPRYRRLPQRPAWR